MRKIIKSYAAILLGAVTLAMPGANAQDQGLGDMIFTVGTVKHIGSDEWAWLQLMATDESLLKNRRLDIYLKQGDMTSTNSFVYRGSATQTTDPRLIAILLERGAALGDNLTNLEVAVDSLYADAAPDGGLTLAEKIAAVISGSLSDDYLYKNLVFMGRAHPSISMAIGQGFACKIYFTGYSTLEVRDHSNNEIIGNITLEAGNPLVLPAPGPIVRVPDKTPKGNLNIKLRWGIPDDLKKVSLMQFGYNLYRMDKDFAVTHGYNITPPSPTAIAGLVSNNTEVVKVNRMPILVDPATVTTNTWFISDDNNAFVDGGTPFVDGTHYLYFVSALDLLGRDGELSSGFETYPCDRMAPTVPHGIQTRTVSDYVSGVATQWVEISWDNDTNDTDVARYYVYRFSSIHEMQSNAVFATSNRISGPILPSPTATRLTFEDRSLSTNDYGQTYYYTVRAEDDASCGHNLSGNSAPAFGLMRDWSGPAVATGVTVTIQVEQPRCWYTNTTKPVLPDNVNLQLTCTRENPEQSDIEWAEFSYYLDTYTGEGSESNATVLGRYYFRPHGKTVTARVKVKGNGRDLSERLGTFFCRVGSKNGKRSNYAFRTDHFYQSINFGCDDTLVPATNSPGPHIWGKPNIYYPVVHIPAVPTARFYKLYRRVDGGKRTLIAHGAMDEVLGAMVTDYTGGAVNGANICYYYQLADQNGNVGPMVLIKCYKAEPRSDLPVPILAAITPTGSATNSPGMELNWFCPPPGVERFELGVAVDEGDLPATFGTSGYKLQSGPTNKITVVVNGVTNTLNFGFYRTGRVGVTFGTAGNPQFILDSDCELGREYTVIVRAVGKVGHGEWSNAQAYRWNVQPQAGDPVPWPARPLPLMQTETFNTNLMPVYLPEDTMTGVYSYDRVGIRIGTIPNGDIRYNNKDYVELNSYTTRPESYLYTNSVATNQTVLPCVLYRYQVTNDLYRSVSGDVSQVSPLMERIAARYKLDEFVRIYDPFIAVARRQDSSDPWGIYLLDTQPVVRGARYRYLILRFDENTKEMDRIIPAGEITIP